MIKKCILSIALSSAIALCGVLSPGWAADKVRIGFLVKQPEEPWFQTEWRFADKAAKDHGFELLKIATPDGERTLAALDSLAANGAQGFVICTPDPRLGPSIVAKAKALNLKVVTVDDRFVGSDGKFMEDVPYLGMDAHAVGQQQGSLLIAEAKKRGWNLAETGAIVNTFEELDTAHQRTSGSVESLLAAGFAKENIFSAANRTTDIPGSFDASNIILTQHPEKKHWLVIGMNDNAVLGGIRATEGAGFKAPDVIGIGINGTDVVAELEKKEVTGLYGSLLLSPNVHGYKTAMMVYDWVSKGSEPAKFTPISDATLITRENFKQKLTEMGLM
ncbi:arabinose ABC transporter substrate-binding protein [Telmatospirillum siberiense]|uniref:L-arabinose-binding periplasmic protein n=1 Tax=Telmatospirillum siberiense TaxID=382514 RepID=A0A2N3PZ83_9PROT|nr:arabinose ABC transporter substrate-binding protein [Telmatospirillum siberiense]PKU25722.1 sugar ABC transporter substrate-binding protein [Telmatospirillum siberiense]